MLRALAKVTIVSRGIPPQPMNLQKGVFQIDFLLLIFFPCFGLCSKPRSSPKKYLRNPPRDNAGPGHFFCKHDAPTNLSGAPLPGHPRKACSLSRIAGSVPRTVSVPCPKTPPKTLQKPIFMRGPPSISLYFDDLAASEVCPWA